MTLAVIDGKVQLSHGNKPGEDVWMEWEDPEPLDVIEFAVMGWDHIRGQWLFHTDKE